MHLIYVKQAKVCLNVADIVRQCLDIIVDVKYKCKVTVDQTKILLCIYLFSFVTCSSTTTQHQWMRESLLSLFLIHWGFWCLFRGHVITFSVAKQMSSSQHNIPLPCMNKNVNKIMSFDLFGLLHLSLHKSKSRVCEPFGFLDDFFLLLTFTFFCFSY